MNKSLLTLTVTLKKKVPYRRCSTYALRYLPYYAITTYV